MANAQHRPPYPYIYSQLIEFYRTPWSQPLEASNEQEICSRFEQTAREWGTKAIFECLTKEETSVDQVQQLIVASRTAPWQSRLADQIAAAANLPPRSFVSQIPNSAANPFFEALHHAFCFRKAYDKGESMIVAIEVPSIAGGQSFPKRQAATDVIAVMQISSTATNTGPQLIDLRHSRPEPWGNSSANPTADSLPPLRSARQAVSDILEHNNLETDDIDLFHLGQPDYGMIEPLAESLEIDIAKTEATKISVARWRDLLAAAPMAALFLAQAELKPYPGSLGMWIEIAADGTSDLALFQW